MGLKIIHRFFSENIPSGTLLELSHINFSYEGHNLCFYGKRHGKLSLSYPCYPFLPGALFLSAF